MPAYQGAQMARFRVLLRAVNPSIDSGLAARVFGRSSLQPLMAILNNANGTAVQVYLAISRLPRDKQEKYRNALTYLLRSYPGMALGGIQLDDLLNQDIPQTRAALYRRTAPPPGFDPDAQPKVLIQPFSSWLDGSVVQYLIANAAATTVMLIHLGSADSGGMGARFNGRTTREYLVSAMRVARVMGCPTAAITIGARGNPPLFPALNAEFEQLPVDQRHVFHHDTQHVCTHQQACAAFLTSRPNCVVMGFDGTICVVANVFGSGERVGDRHSAFKPPVLTFTNVVMSRATIVVDGGLYAQTPTFGRAEYGPLKDLAPN